MQEKYKHLFATPTFPSLDSILDAVRDNHDILIIKMDGARERNQYTVVLMTLVGTRSEEVSRYDAATLEEGLRKVFL